MCHYIPEFWKTLKRYNSRAKALFFAKKQEIKILAFLSSGELPKLDAGLRQAQNLFPIQRISMK